MSEFYNPLINPRLETKPMRRFLQKFPSLLARNFLNSPVNTRHSSIIHCCVVPSLDRATSRFVFFSSESDPTRGSIISDEVVSKEELKKRIQSFLDDGNEDEDALPELFDAIINRKLSGKHDESDDEVMEVVRKYPINQAHKVDDIENDGHGDSSDSDIESDDLSDGDSDIEIDDLNDVDLSDLGIEIDGLRPDLSSDYDSESD